MQWSLVHVAVAQYCAVARERVKLVLWSRAMPCSSALQENLNSGNVTLVLATKWCSKPHVQQQLWHNIEKDN